MKKLFLLLLTFTLNSLTLHASEEWVEREDRQIQSPYPDVNPKIRAVGYFSSSSMETGQKLSFYALKDNGLRQTKKKINLVIVHGLKDHSYNYDFVSGELERHCVIHACNLAFNVWAYDQEHHGYSGRLLLPPGSKPTGNVDSIGENVRNLRSFLKLISKETKGEPIVLFGHSMGGLVVASYMNSYGSDLNIAGVSLSAPALKLFGGIIESAKATTIKFIGGDVPSWTPAIPSFLSKSAIYDNTIDYKVAPKSMRYFDSTYYIEKLKRDPNVNSGLHSVPTAEALIRGIDAFQVRLPLAIKKGHWNVPVYALHNTGDKITNPDGSRELIKKLQESAESTVPHKLSIFEGVAFHDLPGVSGGFLFGSILHWLNDEVLK